MPAATPALYTPPVATSMGRWTVVGDNDGVLWTDDAGSAGVAWVNQTPQIEAIWQFLQNARRADTPAGVAYQIVFDQGGVGDEQYGPFTGLAVTYQRLSGPPVTA